VDIRGNRSLCLQGMPPPYTMNGLRKLRAFTITLMDGSTVKNIYLFKVPHTLVTNTQANSPGLDSILKSLIGRERKEWLPFVKFGLDVPLTEEDGPDHFDPPELPFEEFTTTAGIKVYRLTNHKV
jgi:hypothetical protein